MKKVITIIIVVAFTINSAVAYASSIKDALRPVATAVDRKRVVNSVIVNEHDELYLEVKNAQFAGRLDKTNLIVINRDWHVDLGVPEIAPPVSRDLEEHEAYRKQYLSARYEDGVNLGAVNFFHALGVDGSLGILVWVVPDKEIFEGVDFKGTEITDYQHDANVRLYFFKRAGDGRTYLFRDKKEGLDKGYEYVGETNPFELYVVTEDFLPELMELLLAGMNEGAIARKLVNSIDLDAFSSREDITEVGNGRFGRILRGIDLQYLEKVRRNLNDPRLHTGKSFFIVAKSPDQTPCEILEIWKNDTVSDGADAAKEKGIFGNRTVSISTKSSSSGRNNLFKNIATDPKAIPFLSETESSVGKKSFVILNPKKHGVSIHGSKTKAFDSEKSPIRRFFIRLLSPIRRLSIYKNREGAVKLYEYKQGEKPLSRPPAKSNGEADNITGKTDQADEGKASSAGESRKGMTRRSLLVTLAAAAAGLGAAAYFGPRILTTNGISYNKLEERLVELGYPQEVIPSIIREFRLLLSKVDSQLDIARLREELDPNNPQQLVPILTQLSALMSREGYLSHRLQQPLMRLLVSSLDISASEERDIFSILEDIDMPQEEREHLRGLLLSCVAISGLSFMLLNILDINTFCAIAPEHIFNLIPLSDGDYLFVDFSTYRSFKLDIAEYYEKKGEYFILKQKHRLPYRELLKLRKKVIRDNIVGIDTSQLAVKEVLNLLYPQFYKTDNPCASMYTNISAIYYKLGRYEEALANCQKAIEIDPRLAEAHYHMGNILSKTGRYDETIEAQKRAIQINPVFSDAHYNLAQTYVRMGRFNEAINEYEEAVRLKPYDAKVRTNLGYLYMEMNRDNEAMVEYHLALNHDPHYAGAYYNIGCLYFKHGKVDKAVENWAKAVKLDPKFINMVPNGVKENLKEMIEQLKDFPRQSKLENLIAIPATSLMLNDEVESGDQDAKAALSQVAREIASLLGFLDREEQITMEVTPEPVLPEEMPAANKISDKALTLTALDQAA